ncbi:type IV secretion system DNA-binding domain-containing protein [Candidatus Parcubacteria bacterium]|nr:type IV secretory system conjugative DNA transfer family protein [Patescibacteria group bacterium]MBU4309746.1 type IV secretory system conjugative DNA transfer family protein [Patescibacteria group bacterium]MBU4432194.1 type IV secretory system conjugative DNA transfer family protein [Patescibacteria group bacterium]MBU4578085.1 type IV secretory system conjugative DNA transfer family protein [Patescibacteria group bacterium]MCG2696623.1 type IV secretion system DNA-binding domain-containi
MDYGLQQNINNDYVIDLSGWFWYVAAFAVLFLVLYIARLIIREKYLQKTFQRYVIFLVRLPQDKQGNNQGNETNRVQSLHEEIAKGETIFSSIGGLRAERGFKAWLYGRNDSYSFEIVANKKKIHFYIVAPRGAERYIEQQINAHYPDASLEEVKDYNIFNHKSEILAGTLKTTRHFVLPLRTYLKQDTDSTNSLINVMSKVDEDEGLAIQYTIRSAKNSWHYKASEVVRKANQKKSLSEALSSGVLHKILGFLGDVFHSADPSLANRSENQKMLTVMEQEALKGIEEKNARAGMDVNLRIVVAARDKGRAQTYLENLSSAFSQYNSYEYGNSFASRINTGNKKRIIHDFIYRRFNEGKSFLLNTTEMASLFHLPLKDTETPNILWLTARHAPAPVDTPSEGVYLGYNVHRGVKKDVHIKRDDRRRHMYVVGKSGGGKSQFIANMAVQDIINGEGVCVLDPHGDLVSDILSRIPPERAENVILFRPADIERPMALNLIEFDPKYPEQKTFVINEMIKIFDKLYDLKATGGPIFEQYMRNALLLIMSDPESGSTLMEVPKVLANPAFRKMKLERCADQTVVDFWKQEAEKAGGDAALANVVPYITSKLTQFISNDTMRPIIGQQNSSFNFRDIMDKQKILLVDLSKGAIGEMNAYLLGMIIISKILMNALSRTDIPQAQRKDFYLYIDEFQNFTTDSICSILSEARKYSLNLTIAHQYIGQMVNKGDTTIKDAVFGNVGSMVSFRIGTEDAEFLEKEFSPVFSQYDLLNVEKYSVYTKLLIDNTASRPFSMHCPWPIAGIEREGMAQKIKTLSRLKFGQDRSIIEAEIRRRTSV